uniref:DDE Tnp4 domain-containing protein n=1 Tax=Trichogramma kaykai TaxID=54128 RepID=A0ABD2W148_9HYME
MPASSADAPPSSERSASASTLQTTAQPTGPSGSSPPLWRLTSVGTPPPPRTPRLGPSSLQSAITRSGDTTAANEIERAQRSDDLLANAESWSQYKHHKTIKVLIGITCQGSISFVSKAWGGRTSDKYIVENSGFLKHIIPGDLVLADRGFLIEDSLNSIGATLNIPAFTKGLNQLDPVDLEKTRNIANVRIHVERVIGALKQKYKILSGTLPIDMLYPDSHGVSFIDSVMLVCSVLYNLSPSIITWQ